MNDYNSINMILLVGRVGNDLELKRTKGKNPQSFVRFSIATYRKFKSGTKSTAWHSCSYWGDGRAEWAVKHITKGMFLGVKGHGENRSWLDNAGNKRTVYEIKVQEIIFIGPPKSAVNIDTPDGKPPAEDPAPQTEQKEDIPVAKQN